MQNSERVVSQISARVKVKTCGKVLNEIFENEQPTDVSHVTPDKQSYIIYKYVLHSAMCNCISHFKLCVISCYFPSSGQYQIIV